MSSIGKMTVTLPNNEFDADRLRISAGESVDIDYSAVRAERDLEVIKLTAIIKELREALESLEMIKTPNFSGGHMYSFRCYDMAETYDKLQAAKQALLKADQITTDTI